MAVTSRIHEQIILNYKAAISAFYQHPPDINAVVFHLKTMKKQVESIVNNLRKNMSKYKEMEYPGNLLSPEQLMKFYSELGFEIYKVLLKIDMGVDLKGARRVLQQIKYLDNERLFKRPEELDYLFGSIYKEKDITKKWVREHSWTKPKSSGHEIIDIQDILNYLINARRSTEAKEIGDAKKLLKLAIRKSKKLSIDFKKGKYLGDFFIVPYNKRGRYGQMNYLERSLDMVDIPNLQKIVGEEISNKIEKQVGVMENTIEELDSGNLRTVYLGINHMIRRTRPLMEIARLEVLKHLTGYYTGKMEPALRDAIHKKEQDLWSIN